MNEEQEFQPNLEKLQKFDGKVRGLAYNDLTGYFTISIAKDGKMSSFSGTVTSQEQVDKLVENMLDIIGYVPPVKEETPAKEKEKPAKKKSGK